MSGLGVIVRWLMLLACLVPFTSARQASAAFALSPPPGTPLPTTPAPRQQEDDSEREEESAGQERVRAAHDRPDRHPDTSSLVAFPTRPPRPHASPVAGLTPTDPFRNGLGTPYRC